MILSTISPESQTVPKSSKNGKVKRAELLQNLWKTHPCVSRAVPPTAERQVLEPFPVNDEIYNGLVQKETYGNFGQNSLTFLIT